MSIVLLKAADLLNYRCSYKYFQPCPTTLSSSHHPDLTCLLDLCNQRGIKEVFSRRAERFFQAYHGSGRPRTSLDLNLKLVRFQPSEWCKLNLANYRRPKELRLLHCSDVHPSIQKTSSRTHGELWPATMQPSQYAKSSDVTWPCSVILVSLCLVLFEHALNSFHITLRTAPSATKATRGFQIVHFTKTLGQVGKTSWHVLAFWGCLTMFWGHYNSAVFSR